MLRRLLRKTWVKITLASLITLSVLLLAAYLVFKWLFIPSVPQPEFAKPTSQL